jgi:hypothetical protein
MEMDGPNLVSRLGPVFESGLQGYVTIKSLRIFSIKNVETHMGGGTLSHSPEPLRVGSVQPPRREQQTKSELCLTSQTSNDVALFTIGPVFFGPQDKLCWYDARSSAPYPPPSLLREYVPRQVDNA